MSFAELTSPLGVSLDVSGQLFACDQVRDPPAGPRPGVAVGAPAGAPLGSTANSYPIPGESADGVASERQRLRRFSWSHSKLNRVRECGRRVWGDGVSVFLARSEVALPGLPGGVVVSRSEVQIEGVTTCGSVWACPVCAARVRGLRARMLGAAFTRYEVKGGGLVSVTLTCRHGSGMPLSLLWGAIPRVFQRAMAKDRGMLAFRTVHPFEYVKSREVTWGEVNGWHPHLHLALLTLLPWDRATVEEFRSTLFDAWWSACRAAGLPLPSAERGVHAERACGAAVGEYLTKASGLGSELVRADSKRGRGQSWSPFELLASAAEGDERAARLWSEYERVTFGSHALDFSASARSVLGFDEWGSDEELVASCEPVDGEFVGRELVGVLSRREWHALIHRPGGFELLLGVRGSADFEGVRVACRGDPPWWFLSSDESPRVRPGLVRRTTWRYFDGVEGFGFC